MTAPTQTDDLSEKLYRALQAISSCPHGCKVCSVHQQKLIEALAEFLNRWRAE